MKLKETVFYPHDPIDTVTNRNGLTWFYSTFEIMLTKPVIKALKCDTIDDKFHFVVNTKSGYRVQLNKLTSTDAGSEGEPIEEYIAANYLGQNVNIVKNSTITWETYRTTSTSMGSDTQVKKVIYKSDESTEKKEIQYFRLCQDVNFPLYLPHLWSTQHAYTPGGYGTVETIDGVETFVESWYERVSPGL